MPISLIPSDYNSINCSQLSVYTPQFPNIFTTYYFNYPMQQVIVCGDAKFQIRCPLGQLIYIYAAYFGLESTTNLNYCVMTSGSLSSTIASTTCYSQQAFAYTSGLCTSQSRCSIRANAASYGNPCVSFATSAQLMVQYQCVDSATMGFITQCGLNTTAASICAPLNDTSTQLEGFWCDPLSVSISFIWYLIEFFIF